MESTLDLHQKIRTTAIELVAMAAVCAVSIGLLAGMTAVVFFRAG